MFFTLSPIGFVTSSRTSARDDNWDTATAYIELSTELSSDALKGLGSFSHVIIAYVMDKVNDDEISTGARHPRERSDFPEVGIFAQRGSSRPNRIGITICRVENVEDRRVHLVGLDAIDGSPVIDIKPWVKEFGPRGPVFQPDWMTELMRDYWLK